MLGWGTMLEKNALLAIASIEYRLISVKITESNIKIKQVSISCPHS